MHEDPKPSLDPVDFTNELLNVLIQQFNDSGVAEHTTMYLVLRYDNEWIGSAFGDEEEGLINLAELARVHLHCGYLDKSYSSTVTTQIDPPEIRSLPSWPKDVIDYERPATLAEIGNVKIAFILGEIVQETGYKLPQADQIERYGGSYPKTLDLKEAVPQTTKIFFIPRVQIVTTDGAQEVKVDWAGRVLPGQTVTEGIAAELKETFGYTGNFEWRSPYFRDWAKDNKGHEIQRFGLLVLLYPSESDLL